MICPKCKHYNSVHNDDGGRGKFQCYERNSAENNDFCGCEHGSPIQNQLKLYVVRNSQGHYFHAKGYNGYGKSWVEDINYAKFYTKIGPAKACVTYFSNDPKYPIPDIVELIATESCVIDQKQRVAKVKNKKLIQKQMAIQNKAEYELQKAKDALKLAQDNLKKLIKE